MKRILLVVAVVTAVAGNFAGSPDQSRPPHKQDVAQQAPANTPPVTVIIENGQPGEPAKPTAPQSPKGDAPFQRILVFVGIATCLVIGWQAWESRKAAQAALLNARAVINGERPWLVVRPFIEKKENPKLCLFGCKNQGITPAKIISASARHDFVNSLDDLRQRLPDYSSPTTLPDLRLIVHTDSFRIGHGVDPESLSRATSNVDLVNESRKFLVYYGNVVYRDVLYPESESEGLHETRWCFVYLPHKEGDIKFEQTGPEEYNRYT